ncbi:TMEM175 family protein [Methanobrevibacter sp.]|uniref:TMEM175 family protein n=1 Tax=Methanobrevibacter sp. TaxID=66852 RepID=UPI0025DCE67E|nr:TMEM175 family protein [Methanobrevibacter sp.]MBQ6099617.1 DUF1211 domain-containing protein [Methanobrevibacter sp.]MBQ6513049.1 DUF1211 domain-containing protein [Methanobrevibacter sp.]
MIEIREDASPEDIEELKRSIREKIDVIKENADNEKDIEKLEKIDSFLKYRASTSWDDDKKAKKYAKINKGLSFYQRFKQAFESDVDIDPGRLLGLTDGIFGMVMTLLVFGIALPELQIVNHADFVAFITTLTPTIGVTIVSFVLISSFWIYHHEFIKVKTLNMPYLWLNILFLICISFIPFSTSLIGNYSHFFLSEAVFGLNIFLTLIAFFFMYHYADRRNFLEGNPTKEEKNHVIHTLLIIMGLTVIVNLLDFHVSGSFIYLFLLVPVISTVRDIIFKMKS